MTSRRRVLNNKVPLLVLFGVFVVGAGAIIGTVIAGDPGAIGPDVVVFDLFDTAQYGTYDGKTAYAVGTVSCNRGDVPAKWISNTNEHPVIGQNMYRLKDGRLEQIGMSWLKHGFFALDGNECDTCQPTGGSSLGVGCSDPYWATLNGDWDRLGPRSTVNAFTGEFPYPFDTPTGTSPLRGRIQVAISDVEPASNPSAMYFVEGQYITADDAIQGNGENNASYREVAVSSGLDLSLLGTTREKIAAIYAWEANDAEVTTAVVPVPAEGIFHVAHKATDNFDGTWRYEYAVHNLNSDRSAGSFSVPILQGSIITNAGFHDVDYHSGEPFSDVDWAVTIDDIGGWVTWATEDYATNPNANALRWGTMYNFWFDADQPPQNAMATIGLFKPLDPPGDPTAVETMVLAPVGDLMIFVDGFESGNTSAWSATSG